MLFIQSFLKPLCDLLEWSKAIIIREMASLSRCRYYSLRLLSEIHIHLVKLGVVPVAQCECAYI